MKKLIIFTFILAACCSGCRRSAPKVVVPKEDLAAKKMLQGIWVNSGEEDVAFRAKGDTIFYPDTTSQPVYFQIFGDTLVLHGANESKYPIVKQAPHLFEFRNQMGDLIRLEKSDDPDDVYMFEQRPPVTLNQNQLIKRDTVVMHGDNRFHCYVQVNPTTFKVVKASYNDDGVEVDNIYHDNIIHIGVYKEAARLFSRDFRKEDFGRLVPADFLRQSVLSDISYSGVSDEGIEYLATIAIPDSPSSYMVEIIVGYTGSFKTRIKES